MEIGLTMIKVRPGIKRSAHCDLQKRPEVRRVYPLFGEYDFFLVMQAQGKAELKRALKDMSEKEDVIKIGPLLLAKPGICPENLGQDPREQPAEEPSF